MQIKKIILITFILIFITTTLCIFSNVSKAATYLIDEADLYSKGEIVCLMYKDIKVGVEFVVYEKNGIEYPAYCLNRNLPGVTETDEYTVKVDDLVNNSKIWRAVNNGYPFVSAESLGCNSDIEAFAATKMAVYDMMYNYDWDDFSGLNKQGERVLNAAIKISNAARKSNQTKPSAIIEIKTDDKSWKVDEIDKSYASKTYEVETNVESTEYSVKLKNVNLNNVKIVDINNNEKKEFSSSEKFKILIPITELIEDGKFELEVIANMKTRPILYGKSPDSNKQSYALAAGDYEYENSKLVVNYLKNTTTIELIKKDAETSKFLAGAKFNILNENKEVVYSDITTNEEGKAEISGILPGKYYIEEIKSPDGYTIYDELIEIDVKLNQKYSVDVNNYKKPEDEDKKVEDGNLTTYGEKEVNLPRTGY